MKVKLTFLMLILGFTLSVNGQTKQSNSEWHVATERQPQKKVDLSKSFTDSKTKEKITPNGWAPMVQTDVFKKIDLGFGKKTNNESKFFKRPAVKWTAGILVTSAILAGGYIAYNQINMTRPVGGPVGAPSNGPGGVPTNGPGH